MSSRSTDDLIKRLKKGEKRRRKREQKEKKILKKRFDKGSEIHEKEEKRVFEEYKKEQQRLERQKLLENATRIQKFKMYLVGFLQIPVIKL